MLIRVDETDASTTRGWEEVYEGSLSGHKPVVSPDGDVWLAGRGDAPAWYSVEALLRYDGSRWQVIDVPEGLGTADIGESFAFAPDGTLWAATGLSDAESHEAHDSLARLDGSGWTIFTEAEGVRPWGGESWFATDYLRVAPDGAVWVSAASCDGVASFDGTTWTPYLQGHCVDDFDITPDGAVWVLASADHDDPIHAYAIAPETATAGTGTVVARSTVDEPASAGDGGSPESGSTAGSDVPRTTTFIELEGVPYLTIGEDVFEADIYEPDGDGPSPVVVMFHGTAASGNDDSYTTVVAEAAAAAGLRVFVPNWLTGTTGITPESFDVFHTAANCAVAYAQSKLSDAMAVVVYGFSAGVGPAALASLDPATEPVPGCVAADPPAPVAGAVLGDGEYFLHSRTFDGAFAADPDVMHAVVASLVDPTTWPSGMDTRFFLWVSDDGPFPRASGDPWDETGWLAQRDPDGSIRRDLDRLGQLDDGVINFIDQGQLLELRLREAGIEVSLDSYPGGHVTGDKVTELVGYLAAAAMLD